MVYLNLARQGMEIVRPVTPKGLFLNQAKKEEGCIRWAGARSGICLRPVSACRIQSRWT